MVNLSNIRITSFRPSWLPASLEADVLRLDQLHPEISGNKWFKLKHNISVAQSKQEGILTFGGPYSNHIAATAAACRLANIPCTGIIRGEEHAQELNHTLQTAANNGMRLEFISRTEYREKKHLFHYPGYHIIPEGGHNAEGARGCEEILHLLPTAHYTHILCAAGTGTTLAGLINSALPTQEVIGIPVLKGARFLEQEVAMLLHPGINTKWKLLYDFHYGGYGRTSPALINFMNSLNRETGLPTDIIYTGKLLMAFHELCTQPAFPANSRILLIHTGGLQGNLSLPSDVLMF